MAISAWRRSATCLLWLDPLQSFCVKDSQMAVILFAVVTSEDVELPVVESSGVIFNLRRLDRIITTFL